MPDQETEQVEQQQQQPSPPPVIPSPLDSRPSLDPRLISQNTAVQVLIDAALIAHPKGVFNMWQTANVAAAINKLTIPELTIDQPNIPPPPFIHPIKPVPGRNKGVTGHGGSNKAAPKKR